LQDVALKAAGEHAHELGDRGKFVELCKAKGELAFDILKATMPPGGSAPNCPEHRKESCVERSNGCNYGGNWLCST